MPGITRVLDEVAGLAVTTTKPVPNNQTAHLSGVFLVQAEDVVGRWNVVLELEQEGHRMEIARVSGIQAEGLYPMTLTPPLDRAPAPLIEPNRVRYFTTAQDARFSGSVQMIAVV